MLSILLLVLKLAAILFAPNDNQSRSSNNNNVFPASLLLEYSFPTKMEQLPASNSNTNGGINNPDGTSNRNNIHGEDAVSLNVVGGRSVGPTAAAATLAQTPTPLKAPTPTPLKKRPGVTVAPSKSSELTSFGNSAQQQKLLASSQEHSIAGTVHGSYPCVWQNYNGSIVAGNKAVVFTGSFFFFEKTLILSWDNIRRVERVESTNADLDPSSKRSPGTPSHTATKNGIIEIVVNDDTVHSFFNLHSPEKVWLLLLTLHNDALLGRKASAAHHTPSLLLANPSMMLQRRNSDPTAMISSGSSNNLLFPTNSNGGDDVDDNNDDDRWLASPPSSLTMNRPVVSTVTSMSETPPQTTIEGATGRLKLQPIHCNYAGIAGRLYAGETAIYFTGKRYFWEHFSVMVPWTSIRQIQVRPLESNGNDNTKSGSSSSSSSILGKHNSGELIVITKQSAVQTDGGSMDNEEDTTFQFTNMETPETVRASLIALQNERLRYVASAPPGKTTALDYDAGSSRSAVESPVGSSATKGNRRKSLRRTISDPRNVAHVSFEYDKEETSPDSLLKASVDSAVSTADVNDVASLPVSDSHADAWAALKSQGGTDQAFGNLVVDGHILGNCTLDTFWDLFVADNGQFSLVQFLEGKGDTDLKSTNWAPSDESYMEDSSSNRFKRKRVVQYMHPVNVPLAPPQARARKEQTVTRFGDSGIVVETNTYVDDVPMADCFFVADRIRVEPHATTDGSNDVKITMEFGITFVKSTMFKGIISKKTTSECTLLFKSLTEYMSDALERGVKLSADPASKENAALSSNTMPLSIDSESVEIQLKENVRPIKEPKSLVWGIPFSSLVTPDRILLVCVLFLQMWVMMEVRGIKRSMLMLDNHHEHTNGQCNLEPLA